jgi:hypothetical protein
MSSQQHTYTCDPAACCLLPAVYVTQVAMTLSWRAHSHLATWAPPCSLVTGPCCACGPSGTTRQGSSWPSSGGWRPQLRLRRLLRHGQHLGRVQGLRRLRLAVWWMRAAWCCAMAGWQWMQHPNLARLRTGCLWRCHQVSTSPCCQRRCVQGLKQGLCENGACEHELSTSRVQCSVWLRIVELNRVHALLRARCLHA